MHPSMNGCTLYYSLDYPYVIYYISVWGSTYQCYLSQIIVLQKKMTRIVSTVSFDSHTDDLFNEKRFLNSRTFTSKLFSRDIVYSCKPDTEIFA